MKTKRIYVVFVGMILVGCATGYKPKGVTGGYYEYPAGGKGRYIVGFAGNGFTSPGAANQMAHRRASELCESLGFESYQVVNQSNSNQQQALNSNFRCSSFGSQTNCYQSGGGTVNRPTAEILIACEK